MTILTRNTGQLHIEVAAHIKTDAVVQGNYWDEDTKRGCFIGCLTHSSDPRPAYERFGLTEPIMRLAEYIFESLPSDEATAFFAAFPYAVGHDGKDLSRVHWQFLASELRTLPRTTDTVNNLVDRTIAGMDLLAAGKQWPDATNTADAADAAADAARAAARAARSAADAADAARAAADAARAARSAADAADAARAAADAARAAAWAARSAAWAASSAAWAADAAARSVAWATSSKIITPESAIRRQHDLLLQLVKDAPMGDSRWETINISEV